jgi:hypothetical protein
MERLRGERFSLDMSGIEKSNEGMDDAIIVDVQSAD